MAWLSFLLMHWAGGEHELWLGEPNDAAKFAARCIESGGCSQLRWGALASTLSLFQQSCSNPFFFSPTRHPLLSFMHAPFVALIILLLAAAAY
jgi:hypothetical protein